MEHHSNDFKQWLVGMTDGDGSFSIINQCRTSSKPKFNLVFKISLSTYNLRALYFIKKNLGFGSVRIDKKNKMGSFLIRDRKTLKMIFPIFDQYPLLTSKYFNYFRFKKAYEILTSEIYSKHEKDDLLTKLQADKLCDHYKAPSWKNISNDSSVLEIKKIMSKAWVIGFIEAEGSFYITRKDSRRTTNRYVHGFGISQKLDPIVLESIRRILHISTKVRYKPKRSYYVLDTTQKRSIDNICEYCNKNIYGMKSLEFKIWKRSLKYRDSSEKLIQIQKLLRQIRQKHQPARSC